jgi:crotonobetainyl-CoA:carnitine CoA-transferase CaiB-like acyl-CoA transferase
MDDPRPFAGLKVLDLMWVVAGPAVTRVLADYGATVIRVESSRRVETARLVGPFHGGVPGPEQSVLYGNVNAGKLGLALDLSMEPAREVVRDLVRWADVVAEAYSPGVVGRWGLDYEALRRIKPDLIMLSTSLNGQTGPYAGFAGYGNAGAALSGFQNLVGWPDRPPIGPFGPYTDYVGPRFSLIALLAALDHHRRTGEGCYIDHSQAESGINFLAPQLLDSFATGRIAERNGNRDPRMAPHGVYAGVGSRESGVGGGTEGRGKREEGRVGDGSGDGGAGRNSGGGWVAIAVRDDEEWKRLARLIGGEALAADARFATVERRLACADALDEIVGARTAERDAREIETLLQGHGIPAYLVQSSPEMLADPQLRHRGHFIELAHPLHGTTVVEASRFKLSRTPAVTDTCAPTFGRDNDRVLRDILGYDDERIAALAAAGALE